MRETQTEDAQHAGKQKADKRQGGVLAGLGSKGKEHAEIRHLSKHSNVAERLETAKRQEQERQTVRLAERARAEEAARAKQEQAERLKQEKHAQEQRRLDALDQAKLDEKVVDDLAKKQRRVEAEVSAIMAAPNKDAELLSGKVPDLAKGGAQRPKPHEQFPELSASLKSKAEQQTNALLAAMGSDHELHFGTDDGVLHAHHVKKHYPVCIRHSCATEWHYYHMFEMNLDAIIHPLNKYKDQGGAVVLLDALKPAMLTKWINALSPDGSNWDVTTDGVGKTYTCGEVVEATGKGFDAQPEIRSSAYAKLQLDVMGSDSESREKPVVCYFDRAEKYVSNNAGDHQRTRARSIPNKAELKAAAEKQGFEFRDLVFGSSTAGDLDPENRIFGVSNEPLEQVRAVSQCDLAFGMHGAQLTNFMFLRPGAKALQISPYGLKKEDNIDTMYSAMAKMGGLQYTRLTPASNKDVDIDWDQMLDDAVVKQKVCAYGVDKLYEHGTSAFAPGQDTTWLSVFFYINQNIHVDAERFTEWLGNAADFAELQHSSRSAYAKLTNSVLHHSLAETSADSARSSVASTVTTTVGSYLRGMEAGLLAVEDRVASALGMDAFAATKAKLSSALKKLDVDGAREYCKQHPEILSGTLDA